jgi:hypothetical protein
MGNGQTNAAMTVEEPSDLRGRQNTPLWMDTSGVHEPSVTRRGVAPAPRAGLGTLLFFGLIVVAVGAAGLIGVSVWGPEKTITNRSHLASDPPPPPALPSLPPAAESSVVASAEPAAAPNAAAAAPAESAAPVKKAKRTFAAPRSKHR